MTPKNTLPAEGGPFVRPVGRPVSERPAFRMTTNRQHALALLAGGKVTHPGAQGMCYVLERAGLTEWVKAENRYRLTASGIAALAAHRPANDSRERETP